MIDQPKCPDCGASMVVTTERKVGPLIQKQEVGLLYLDRPEEYAKLPQVLGRQVGETHTEERCTRCMYRAIDGMVVERGGK